MGSQNPFHSAKAPEFSWGEATIKSGVCAPRAVQESCSGHKAEASRGCLFCYLILFFFHFLLLFIFHHLIFSEFTCQKHHPNFIPTKRTRLNSFITTYLKALLAFPHLQVTC